MWLVLACSDKQGKEMVVLSPRMVERVREATIRYGVLFESYQVSTRAPDLQQCSDWELSAVYLDLMFPTDCSGLSASHSPRCTGGRLWRCW